MSYSDVTVAKVYANSVAMLCKSKEDYVNFRQNINSLADLITENQDLKRVFFSPIFSDDIKRKVMLEISSLSGFTDFFKKFLQLLISRKRESLLIAVSKEFEKIYMEYVQEANIEVISASKLSSSYTESLKKSFSTYLNKKVTLNKKTDKNILGGIIIKMDSLIFDASLSSKLEQLYYITNKKIKKL